MVWKNFRRWLRIGALAGSMLIPNVGKCGGSLEIVNYSSDFDITPTSVMFTEDASDLGYNPSSYTPSFEIYSEDSSSNKLALVNVNLSTNKSSSCLLAGQGTIVNGKENDLAIKIINPFPSNTLCSMAISNVVSTNISDVIKYYNDNPKDGDGYVHIQMPATTNASNRVYGNVQIRFAPLETIIATSAYGKVYFNGIDTGTNYAVIKKPYGDPLTISVSPTTNDISNVRRVVLKKPPKVTGHRFTQP